MRGQPALLPFAARPLMAWASRLLGGQSAWVVLSRAALIASIIGWALLMASASATRAGLGIATAVLLTHPALARYWWRYPVLTDQASGLILVAGLWAAWSGNLLLMGVLLGAAALTREWTVAVLAAAGLPWFGLGIVLPTVLAVGIYGLIYLLARQGAAAPAAGDIRFAPMRARIRYYLRRQWGSIIWPWPWWGIVLILAVAGAFRPAARPWLAFLPAAAVSALPGCWSNNVFRYHLMAWPIVLGLVAFL